jgi:small subunit ribosomal protein S20
VASSLQSKKRAKQNVRTNTINRARKSRVKTQIKHFEEAIEAGDTAAAAEQLRLVSQKLDKTASTSTMHKKTASRKKSRLAKQLNKLNANKA